ncbi:MAG: superoxide dismutase [Ni] [Victivallales bacterium]|nr:superoxide dismutase [Ni] [Victivallales bacterium]
MTRKKLRQLVVVGLIFLSGGTTLMAHCEIPCGIYHDDLRLAMMSEHIDTIAKSLAGIKAAEAARPVDYNQLVRWINNKDEHAVKIQEIVWQYFLTQRIKPTAAGNPAYDKYIRELTLLHELSVYAMKAKQSTDPVVVDKLRELLQAFRASYQGRAAASHEQRHGAAAAHK